MKGALLIGAIILFIIVFYNVCNDAIEEFRGAGLEEEGLEDTGSILIDM
jgi:hypothetical protein